MELWRSSLGQHFWSEVGERLGVGVKPKKYAIDFLGSCCDESFPISLMAGKRVLSAKCREHRPNSSFVSSAVMLELLINLKMSVIPTAACQLGCSERTLTSSDFVWSRICRGWLRWRTSHCWVIENSTGAQKFEKIWAGAGLCLWT